MIPSCQIQIESWQLKYCVNTLTILMIKEIKRKHWYSSGDFTFIIWQYFPDAMLSFYKNQSTNFHCKSITWFMVYIATLAKRKKIMLFFFS